MTILAGPWTNSEVVNERRLVRKWLEVWPQIEAMPTPVRVQFLLSHGFTVETLLAMHRILERHKQDVLRHFGRASA